MIAPQLAKASFLEKMLGSSVPLADDAPVLGSNKKQKRESTEVEAGHKEEEEEESGPAWLKGDFLTGSANKKDATGWDQIAEEEEEEGEEIL